MARTTRYDRVYLRWAEKLARRGGYTRFEIAELLELGVSTLYRWAAAYPEFREALKAATRVADARVEERLYERAVGYSFVSEKIFCKDGVVTRAKFVEHVPPDVTAQIFWLKNRDQARWRDKVDHEHAGNVRWVFGDPTQAPPDYDRKSPERGPYSDPVH